MKNLTLGCWSIVISIVGYFFIHDWKLILGIFLVVWGSQLGRTAAERMSKE